MTLRTLAIVPALVAATALSACGGQNQGASQPGTPHQAAVSPGSPGAPIANLGRLITPWTEVTHSLGLPNPGGNNDTKVMTATLCDVAHRRVPLIASRVGDYEGGNGYWEVKAGGEELGTAC